MKPVVRIPPISKWYRTADQKPTDDCIVLGRIMDTGGQWMTAMVRYHDGRFTLESTQAAVSCTMWIPIRSTSPALNQIPVGV